MLAQKTILSVKTVKPADSIKQFISESPEYKHSPEYPFFSPKKLKDFLGYFSLHMSKSRGQNFLIAENTAAKLVATISETNPARVLEIGPGLGALSYGLRAKAELTVVEYDRFFAGWLATVLNQTQVNHLDFRKFPGPFDQYDIVCGNLPYSVTTECIEHILQNSPPSIGYFLVQKEFAERLTAGKGKSSAQRQFKSSFALYTQLYGDWTKLYDVGPGNFFPTPKVDSSLLKYHRRLLGEKISLKAKIPVLAKNFFWGKRKTVARCLDSAPFWTGHSREIRNLLLEKLKNPASRDITDSSLFASLKANVGLDIPNELLTDYSGPMLYEISQKRAEALYLWEWIFLANLIPDR